MFSDFVSWSDYHQQLQFTRICLAFKREMNNEDQKNVPDIANVFCLALVALSKMISYTERERKWSGHLWALPLNMLFFTFIWSADYNFFVIFKRLVLLMFKMQNTVQSTTFWRHIWGVLLFWSSHPELFWNIWKCLRNISMIKSILAI